MKLLRSSKDIKEALESKKASANIVLDVSEERPSDLAAEDTVQTVSAEVLDSQIVTEEVSIDILSENANIQSHDAESVDIDLDLDADMEDDGKGYKIDRYVAQILPEEIVRRFNILPIRIEDDELQVITVDPLNLPGMDQVKLMTGLRVRPIIVSEKELSLAISEQFSSGQASKQAIIDMTFQEMEITQRAD